MENQFVLHITDTSEFQLISFINYVIVEGYLIDLDKKVEFSAHEDESEKNKFFVEEHWNFEALRKKNAFLVGNIIIREIRMDETVFLEVIINIEKNIQQGLVGKSFLENLFHNLHYKFPILWSSHISNYIKPSLFEEKEDTKNRNIDELYLLIPDRYKNREMVRLWNSGFSLLEISEKLRIEPETVNNQICKLRKKYSDKVVLRNSELIRLGIK